ncbi:ATP-dependent Clp protease proteolytic subunit [Striga asiatica]|uniref:ATP-dependent Clp protease proteolytic subunit n=1 Tax=Striga asiatica TaxID=4170 RepID=A0A5A7QCN1_STRAF|nr:ATP-dependent Clp protease proteolytic subunit [Striga asiatica]
MIILLSLTKPDPSSPFISPSSPDLAFSPPNPTPHAAPSAALTAHDDGLLRRRRVGMMLDASGRRDKETTAACLKRKRTASANSIEGWELFDFYPVHRPF